MTQPETTAALADLRAETPDIAWCGRGGLFQRAAAELERQLAEADRVIACLEIGREPWTAELMTLRNAAINRHRERNGKGPLP